MKRIIITITIRIKE